MRQVNDPPVLADIKTGLVTEIMLGSAAELHPALEFHQVFASSENISLAINRTWNQSIKQAKVAFVNCFVSEKKDTATSSV